MKTKHTIFFEFFGKKMKYTTYAESKEKALAELKSKIKVHNIKSKNIDDNDILNNLEDQFDIISKKMEKVFGDFSKNMHKSFNEFDNAIHSFFNSKSNKK